MELLRVKNVLVSLMSHTDMAPVQNMVNPRSNSGVILDNKKAPTFFICLGLLVFNFTK
jgi:hypothetical protein